MFKNQLKYYRKLTGMSQYKVAEILGITQAGYAYYENGTREPSIEMLKKLCILFNCTSDELLEIDNPADRKKVVIHHSFNNSNNIKIKI